MTHTTTLRLGTRSSPLAQAQSRRIADAIRRTHPGIAIALQPLATSGDHRQSVPLRSVEQPDFFSAELDEALLRQQVDICVHSRKDLPPAPRRGIVRAAVPRREDPRDVVVFAPGTVRKLRAGHLLKIGTSSRRRRQSVTGFLPRALPGRPEHARVSCVDLRGPVEQRLARLHAPEDSGAHLDGVVLALAGLIRLFDDDATRPLIEPLLQDIRWMVLPLGSCPTAPGQGALVVECRVDDTATRQLLADLDDPQSAARVEREFTAAAAAGDAACRYTAATALPHPLLGELMWARLPDHAPDTPRARLLWDAPPAPVGARPWRDEDRHRICVPVPLAEAVPEQAAVFVAHWHAAAGPRLPERTRVWTSGETSWLKLARMGIWVEGCADNLGFEFIRPTLQQPVLGLPPLHDWLALTHRQAVAGWADTPIGRAVARYQVRHDHSVLQAAAGAIGRASHFYWGSPQQFRAARQWLPADAWHACGPGRTAAALRQDSIDRLMVFPSRQEWNRWLG